MDQLNELLKKCIDNNLNFDYDANTASVSISKMVGGGRWSCDITNITDGYIDNWKWETPERVVTRLHHEVNEFLESEKAKENVV